ncbi:MAG: hypothetical protein LIO91_03550 [Bacteroidales bacterium]|nr:hypothetical protein [Bacteroidales bacterium]
MTQETYVTYDTAQLLRKAGFPQAKFGEFGDCTDYDEDWTLFWYDNTKGWLQIRQPMIDEYACAAPTQAVAMRWLRDLNDDIPSTLDIASVPKNGMWVDKTGTGHCKGVEYWLVHHAGHPHFDTYEQAAEAGIQAACRWLIEKGGSDDH